MKTIDITPSRDGYIVIKETMKKSIQSYQGELKGIESLLQRLDDGILKLPQVTDDEFTLITESLASRESEILKSVEELRNSVNEIDAYLEATESEVK